MSDRISLRGMRFLGRHGVTLEERLEPQPIEVDVELEMDLERPSATDELADTIDYGAVFELVRGIVEQRSFRLLEALAGEVAGSLLGAHGDDQPPMRAVEVRVRKPQAPLPGPFESVEVTLRRSGPTRRDAGSA
ncbi:MAG TPA: dihydroneopterin aldolase [Candidatus Limnocylindria bacterium]|nr:dihydroneopterin aldolase [Candidatus Limnocylindria bacterium]